MAGETIRTEAICLSITPWSQTSHVVTWLTPGAGPVSTVVKGACRPKSAFLGQYDLYYTCELVYYARAHGDAHIIRECAPLNLRDGLRGDWRRTAYAGYAAYLCREHCPHGAEAAAWYRFLETELAAEPDIVRLELRFLELSGLAPDFSGGTASGAGWSPFSIARGGLGEGERSVRLSDGARRVMEARLAPRVADAGAADPAAYAEAVRFLGMFLAWHVEMPPEIRRGTLRLLAAKAQAVKKEGEA